MYLASVDASGNVAVWERAAADPAVATSAAAAAAAAARPEVVLRRVAPKIDAGGAARIPVAWHPDGGSLLAVAGAEAGEVLLFERLSWAPAAAGAGDDGVLRGGGGGGHKASPVRVLAFSPNGLYLLSGDAAGDLCVWDVSSTKRRVVARARLGGESGAAASAAAAAPSAAAWRPGGNEVSVALESGAVAVWRLPLPESMPGPTADPEAVLAAAAAAGAATKTTATEDDDELSDGEEEDDEQGESGDEMDEDGDGSTELPSRRRPASLPGSRRPPRPLPRVASHIPQAPIAPGSTRPDRSSGSSFSSASSGAGSHRWLAYTSLGCVSSRRGDGCAVVEVQLHDRSSAASQARGGRVPLLNDFFGFDLAALGPKGVLYAAPPADDGSAARRRRKRREHGDDDGDDDSEHEGRDEDVPRGVLVFRPFAGWPSGGGWTADLPRGRRAACLASGSTFAAAATSPDRCLRLFSPAGLQTAVATLPGDPVALAAQSGKSGSGGSLLAAVWHGPAPSDPRDQSLVVAVLDGSPVHGDGGAAGGGSNGPLAAVAAAAPLPLSRGASLTWLGFSDDGGGCLLASFDSRGVMRVRPAADAGAPWTPVFDARRTGAGGRRVGARFWPVGFTRDALHCVVAASSSSSSTSAAAAAAAAGPGERPVVSVEPLRVPALLLAGEATAGGVGEEATATAAAAAADLADASLRAGAFLHGVRASVAAGVSAASSSPEEGGGEEGAELAIAAAEAAADRALLRAFHAALKARALERALEAAGRLCLTRSLEGALKLANHHRVPALAERVSALLSARLEMEQAMAFEGGNGTPARNAFGASPAAADAEGSNPFMRSSAGAATAPLAPRDANAAPASAPRLPPPKFSAAPSSAEKGAAPSPSAAAKEAAGAAVNPFLRKVKQARA